MVINYFIINFHDPFCHYYSQSTHGYCLFPFACVFTHRPRPEVPEPLPDPVNDQRYAISKSLISRIPIADYAGSNLISTKINKWKSSLEVWLVGEKSNRLLQKSIFSSKFFMIHCPWTQAQDRDYLKFSVRFLDLWVLGTFHFFPFLFHRFHNVKIALGPCRYCR